MPARFRIITIFEGLDTGDKRHINVEALSHRGLPLTLMGMTRNPDSPFGGHGGAEVVGRIDTLQRVDASSWVDEATGQTWQQVAGGPVFAWVGEGEFDDRPEAADVEQLVRDGHLRGVSADLAEVESELEILEEDEDGWPIDWRDTVTAGMIAAATVCNVPAFRGCTIELIDDDAGEGDGESEPAEDAVAASGEPWLPAFRVVNDGPGCEPCITDPGHNTAAVVASGGPLHPPAAWFDDPGLEGPTPLTVTDDGRVYGHLALWGTCHTGRPGECFTPPRSATNYALFHVGALRTAEGTDVPVGHITLGAGHADTAPGVSMAQVRAHYDNTAAVVADVAAGEDDHGVWVAGGLRPGVTDEQVRELRAAPLSGDWRRHGGNLELMAALAVNAPGYLVPRVRAVAASGVPVALVAAGAAPVALLRAEPVPRPSRADAIRTATRIGEARQRVLRAQRQSRWGRRTPA